jgi:formylglycine-generating enzyme required for sulfatase activity
MRSTPLRLVPLLALLAALPAFLVAQTLPTRGFSVIADDEQSRPVEVRLYRKMAAVVIGIDRYQNARHNLKYAVRDAEGMEKVLSEQYGFDPVYTLYDEDATRDSILELLQTTLRNTTTQEDAVLVFFSGHGDTIEGTGGPVGYLVPHDGDFGQPHRNISMETLRGDVSRLIPARHVFFVVDACYSGILATRGGEQETSRNVDYLRSVSDKPARQVLTAGMADEQVLDGGPLGFGVFTGRVVEALQTASDYVTARELAVTVGERVFSDAEQRGHKQTPTYGELSGDGDFVFVPKRKSNSQLAVEIAELEAALASSRQAQEQAEGLNDAERRAEELQRQAEMAEKLRQAKEAARIERQRQARAVEAEASALREADRRREEDRARLENEARAADLRRKLEQQQVEEDAARTDMTLSEAVTRLAELGKKITDIEATVRSEIAQEKELVRPASIQKMAKDQFETTTEFGDRKRSVDEANASERARYEREIAAADASLPGRLVQATSGFEAAIAGLTTQERPVSANQITVELGAYDADAETFSYQVRVKGVSSPITGLLGVPRADALLLYEASQAGAMTVTMSSRVSADGSVHLGDPSFSAPNLTRAYAPLTETGRLLRELYIQDLAPTRRREIGVRLAEIGDLRPGVGAKNGVPDIEWVLVSPGGSVDIRGTRKNVSPFYIARYPVTYAQYEAFVKASDGFDSSAWWRGMPSKYTPPQHGLNSQRNTLRSAPRETVSWYQAVAFTRWLSVQLRDRGADVSSGGARVSGSTWEVRLPTEWEWQWAAQGGAEKRTYPWGSWEDGRANAGHVLDSTTAVGMHPQGVAASGALDMSGNVWEWCQSKYSSPHSIAVDDTNEHRVLRGGSFNDSRVDAASSFRNSYGPPDAWYDGGFRVGLFPPL